MLRLASFTPTGFQFTPFGQELDIPTTNMHYKFMGKARDTESGLDYFGARYYASSMGQWMSPDWASKPTAVPYAKYANPQSLNLYSYGGNNPLSSVDTDGHELIDPRAIAAFAAKAAHVAGSVGIGLAKFAANVLSFGSRP